jgi:hypothetical protein
MLHALLTTSTSASHVSIASHANYTPVLAAILADPLLPTNMRDFFAHFQLEEAAFDNIKRGMVKELGRQMNEALSELWCIGLLMFGRGCLCVGVFV